MVEGVGNDKGHVLGRSEMETGDNNGRRDRKKWIGRKKERKREVERDREEIGGDSG